MSHFVTFVLIPKDTQTDQIERTVALLLEPFNENREVPEYDRACYCVGSKARQDIRDRRGQNFPIEELRARYREAAEGRCGIDFDYSKEGERLWKRICAQSNQWTISEEKRLAVELKEPNPECEECHGSGTLKSNYNKQSKWDWWSIGGRWSRETDVFPVSELFEGDQLKENMCPFACLTPDGEWHENGEMGYWAIVSNEKEEEDWLAECTKVLKAHQDCLVVNCDLHI